MKQYILLFALLMSASPSIVARKEIPATLRTVTFNNNTSKKTGVVYKITVQEIATVELPENTEKPFIIPPTKDNEAVVMRVAKDAPAHDAINQLLFELETGDENHSLIKLTGKSPGTFSFGKNYNPSQPFTPLVMLQ